MPENQPIKIQLNSEKAIRSLIDNDPELQLEIKTKIACVIADGYGKINTKAVDSASDYLSQVVKNNIYNELTEIDSYNNKRYLKSEIKEMIKNYTDSQVSYIVWEIVNKKDEELRGLITEKVDQMAERIVNNVMEEAFNNSVRDEVIRRFEAIQKKIYSEIINE